MLGSLTGYDLFAAIMMARQVDQRLVLLVESEEDCGVIDPHLNSADIHSIPGFGKQSVLEAATLLTQHRTCNVLCLIDSDFDPFTGQNASYPANVVSSEFYDLDADVLFHDQGAVKSLAVNFSRRDARETYLTSKALDLQDLVIEVSAAVGALRRMSVHNSLGYSLSDFPMQYAVKGFESGSLCAEIIRMADLRSPAAPAGGVDPVTLAGELASLSDKRVVCRGHDIISTLSVLFRGWGSGVGHKELESAARARVSCQVWRTTVFFREVASWASESSAVAWTC